MIEMFVRTKHKIDKRHEFALVVVNDDALWVSTRAVVSFLCVTSKKCRRLNTLLAVCLGMIM